jgi:ribosomal protein S18 acetylase RimI-like enzyme
MFSSDIVFEQVVNQDQIAIVRTLFAEYAEDIDIDLEYQGFSAELASLPAPYAPPTGCLYIACSGSAVVGCVAMKSLGNRIAEMKRLYVRPAYRSLGLGRRLVEAVIHAAQQAAYRELRLDTLASMAPARALYQRLGFQEIAPYSSTYHPDTCFYALRL